MQTRNKLDLLTYMHMLKKDIITSDFMTFYAYKISLNYDHRFSILYSDVRIQRL